MARDPTEYLMMALSLVTRRIGKTVTPSRATDWTETKMSLASRIDGSVTKRVCQVKYRPKDSMTTL